MPNLEYSNDALNALNKFHNVKVIVYVEGEDDIPFWSKLFATVPNFSFECRPVYGASALDKIIDKICKNEVESIVGRDADYLRFKREVIENPRVIYTYGYAMENTIYTKSAIQKITEIWCRSASSMDKDCEEWIKLLCDEFHMLLTLDIANELADSGLNVMGDNCSRFMIDNKSDQPCKKKINGHQEKLLVDICKNKLAQVKKMVPTDWQEILSTIRGHFLASAVIKFISTKANGLGMKRILSNDSLYSDAMILFNANFSKEHPHYNHYSRAVSSAAKSFK